MLSSLSSQHHYPRQPHPEFRLVAAQLYPDIRHLVRWLGTAAIAIRQTTNADPAKRKLLSQHRSRLSKYLEPGAEKLSDAPAIERFAQLLVF